MANWYSVYFYRKWFKSFTVNHLLKCLIFNECLSTMPGLRNQKFFLISICVLPLSISFFYWGRPLCYLPLETTLQHVCGHTPSLGLQYSAIPWFTPRGWNLPTPTTANPKPLSRLPEKTILTEIIAYVRKRRAKLESGHCEESVFGYYSCLLLVPRPDPQINNKKPA